jgi:hypothetical protein
MLGNEPDFKLEGIGLTEVAAEDSAISRGPGGIQGLGLDLFTK